MGDKNDSAPDWRTVYELLLGWSNEGEWKKIRLYAMMNRIYQPVWCVDDEFFTVSENIVRIYLHAIGWDYDDNQFIEGMTFDPYEEVSAQALIDCNKMERISFPERGEYDYNVRHIIYRYMRGGFPFVVGGKDLCKENGIELPYSTIDASGEDFAVIRVPRSYSVMFRGDKYNYNIIADEKPLKVYLEREDDKVWLVRDKYGRIWFCVENRDSFDDREERNFELVESEEDADCKYRKMTRTYHYISHVPYFFSSENYDFILHDDVGLPKDRESVIYDLEKMNQGIPPQMYRPNTERNRQMMK